MTQIIVQCDEAPIPDHWRKESGDSRLLRITKSGPNEHTLRLQELSSDPLAGTLKDRASDLVSIAAYVYVADQLVSRGGLADIYGKGWHREFFVCLPVNDPDFWNAKVVCGLLEQTLSFVSGEAWNFTFSASQSPQQLSLGNINQRGVRYDPDSVILFSGGIDSLCATVEAVLSDGLKPVLVSHRSVPFMSSVQQRLIEQLRAKIPSWKFPRSKFVVNKVKTDEHDTMQRTRSFLFASLGASVASSLEISKVLLADNGITSLNIPINDQLLGSLASRSTHPRFISLFNALARAVLPGKPEICNPLYARTKAEALEILKKHNMLDLLHYTNSCAHRRNLSIEKPQCGVCSQCVERRFALLATGLGNFDPVVRYRTNIFRDPLYGNDLIMAESYFRFAKIIEPLASEEIYSDYSQLAEAVLPDDPSPQKTILELTSLMKRHASTTINVMASQVSAASKELILDKLPSTCLISLSVPHQLSLPDNEKVSAQNYMFKRTGDYWVTRFEGKHSIIKHLRGMTYIAYLLANPNKDIPVFDFISSDKSGVFAHPNYQGMSEAELEKEGLSIRSDLGDTGEILDDQAKKQYRERLREIEDDLTEAKANDDLGRVEQLEYEREALVHELKAAVGLGGRDRKAGSVAERARVSVSLSIQRAIKRIGKHDQKLAQFLTNSISTGITCKYSPDQEIPWIFS